MYELTEKTQQNNVIAWSIDCIDVRLIKEVAKSEHYRMLFTMI